MSHEREWNLAWSAALSGRGHQRERDTKRKLEDDDWFVVRAAGSLGDVDLVCLKDGNRPRLVEVKSTAAGPYHSFGPADRAGLRLAARIAGAEAWLVWWPPRGKPHWISESEWPKRERLTPSIHRVTHGRDSVRLGLNTRTQ